MALPAPAHVNQLTAGTKFPNGQPSGPYDCAVAAGRMALDAYSHGALRPSTTEFRKAQQDQDHNGIGLDDIAAAWRHWNQRFDYGSKPFRLVYERLVAGDGACIPGNYGNMGSWSAQPSFRGSHMMWLQRTAPGGILTDDPLRSSAVVIPTATIERFYGGSAGWGHGIYAGDTTGGTADETAMPAAWNGIVQFPTGHIITVADVDAMIRALDAAHFFDSYPLHGLGSTTPQDAVRGVLMTAVGKPWNKALQDELARRFGAAATAAGDPIGGAAAAVGAAIQGAGIDLVVNVAIIGTIIGLAYTGLKNLMGSASAATPVTITNLVPAATAPAAAAAGAVVKQLGGGKRPPSRPRPTPGRTRGPVPVFVVPKPEGRK